MPIPSKRGIKASEVVLAVSELLVLQVVEGECEQYLPGTYLVM